jgi:glycosyltransferase involved in cell wall biosynthesis
MRTISTPLPNAADLRILMLSAAVPQTSFAGSLLLYRLLRHHPPQLLKAVGPRPQPSAITLGCEYAELRPARSSRLDVTRFAAAKRSLEALSLLGRIPDGHVERAVGGFPADVVVTVMERFDYVDAAHRYCQRHRLPLAVIVHDRLEAFDRVYPAFAGAQRRRIAAIYRDAAVRLCVSPEMEQCLARAYGAPGTVLYPNRSEDLTARPLDESLTLKAPPALTIGYAGAMNYGYGEAIQAAMPALAAAGIAVRVYSREAPPAMPGVTYAGAFRHTGDPWADLKDQCDAVWLPYAEGAAHQTLYETHFPSKLAEYLALGMPVVISGPEYATGVRWGLRHPDATLTVAAGSADQVRAAFERVRDDAALRRRLAEAARRAGDADFDPQRIREGFMGALSGHSHVVAHGAA